MEAQRLRSAAVAGLGQVVAAAPAPRRPTDPTIIAEPQGPRPPPRDFDRGRRDGVDIEPAQPSSLAGHRVYDRRPVR